MNMGKVKALLLLVLLLPIGCATKLNTNDVNGDQTTKQVVGKLDTIQSGLANVKAAVEASAVSIKEDVKVVAEKVGTINSGMFSGGGIYLTAIILTGLVLLAVIIWLYISRSRGWKAFGMLRDEVSLNTSSYDHVKNCMRLKAHAEDVGWLKRHIDKHM